MEDWGIVGLTAALVVVTWLYQRDTHRMVDRDAASEGRPGDAARHPVDQPPWRRSRILANRQCWARSGP